MDGCSIVKHYFDRRYISHDILNLVVTLVIESRRLNDPVGVTGRCGKMLS